MELSLNSKFCNECGAPVTQVSRSAEYKQVTVLFADVVHSMDIAAAVGAERLREIMTDLVSCASSVVQRYGGTVGSFTGDGIMAMFGAPVALEDHAIRACLAGLAIQDDANRLAVEVQDRDRIELRLRVGLNSGQVIAGGIGWGPFGYTAVGEQVGMAQRMESVSSPGGVMLSASTARLVEGTAAVGERELVYIKGAGEPVAAYRLMGMRPDRPVRRTESKLVGRRWEMSTVEGLLDRAIDGHGFVVGAVGPPGIGKSRLVRELSAMAAARDVEVFTTFCESHTSQIPFQAVARLLRATTGVEGLDAQVARDYLRERVSDADPEDLLLFDDLLGIGDSDAVLPRIDPDARRRRLTALVNAASLARETPAVYVVDDAHWIDEVSESMLADFFTVIPQTPSLVLVTYRPEYGGALTRLHGTQTITLEPLNDTETAALVSQLLGSDPSISRLGQTIAESAAGNPFFAEEIVRELAERGVLRGEPGARISTAQVAEVSVPATLQATIAARIDRLTPAAKRTLGAAAVIGSKFSRVLLETLRTEPVLDDLVGGELIDQLTFTGQPEYVFHHPLIRTVAYESQLKSDRAELHRRVAAAIESRDPAAADENAASIAHHLEAAEDLCAAYGWRMRAARWSTNRDIRAAQLSWERACQLADSLPSDHLDRTAMRIAPRALLCGSAWRVHAPISHHFEELRRLCIHSSDKSSLAIGMAGLVGEHLQHGRVQEASRLASEYMALVESIDDPTLTVGAARAAIHAKLKTGEVADVLRWSQSVIDLAGGDPAKGDFIMGSPLAAALAHRGFARFNLGLAGWRQDLVNAVAMARGTDPTTYAAIVNAKYGPAIPCGVLLPNDGALREMAQALHVAGRSGEDVALGSARMALGIALVHRGSADRVRGVELLEQVRDMCQRERFLESESPWVDVYLSRERAGHGDLDGAIELIRTAVDDLFNRGQLAYCVPTTGVLVETLLARGTARDQVDAEHAVDRLAIAPADNSWVIRELMLLRLRALLAQTRGATARYRDLVERYRTMATSLGYEGHVAWAEAMK
jgi:class 3 adenylate cyclase